MCIQYNTSRFESQELPKVVGQVAYKKPIGVGGDTLDCRSLSALCTIALLRLYDTYMHNIQLLHYYNNTLAWILHVQPGMVYA